MKYPLLMRVGWFLASIRLAPLAGVLRQIVYRNARLTLTGKLRDPSPLSVRYYERPEHVGYRGWIEHKQHGILAFFADDDSLQFVW